MTLGGDRLGGDGVRSSARWDGRGEGGRLAAANVWAEDGRGVRHVHPLAGGGEVRCAPRLAKTVEKGKGEGTKGGVARVGAVSLNAVGVGARAPSPRGCETERESRAIARDAAGAA